MTKADAEDRFFADEIADLSSLILQRFRIAGAIREKHSIRIQRQHVVRRCERGNHGYASANLHQSPQNIALDSVIVGDHVAPWLGCVAYTLRGGTARYRFVPS